MTKFIKLTNDTDVHKGNPIYINADHITAIYDAAIEGGNIKTFVFGGHTGVQWEVEETPKQVLDLINPVEYM
jgi:hypothetical protein